MSYPKYFFSPQYSKLYVITSDTKGYSLSAPTVRGLVENWTVKDMKELGNKPATEDQIRRFIPDYKPAPRKPAVKITPLHPKLTLPEGFVYLGMAGEFKRPSGSTFRGDCARVADGEVYSNFRGEVGVAGDRPNYYYIAKIGSPVALLNGHKAPKTSALKTALSKLAASEVRCAALTEENLRLRAIIAASKKELEKA